VFRAVAPAGQTKPATIRVAHLPVYPENAYQPLLFSALAETGVQVIQGGGGGNFFRTARFKWKADILHFHWVHPYILRPGRLGTVVRGTRFIAELTALKRAGQRIVWTVHNLKNHERHQLGLEWFFTRQFVRLADAIIAHSQYAKKAAAEHFRIRVPERLVVIPHGNYIKQYGGRSDRRDARSRLGIDADAVVFLLFGRLHAYKGVIELLEAFSQIQHQAVLILAGPPADKQTEDLIESKCAALSSVIFHPRYVPDQEVSAYFSACDAVVLPYHDVLTSGSGILAMSLGKACIAPNIGSLPETFAAAGALLYDAKKKDGLLDAMRAAIARKSDLGQMGAANLARAQEWSWERVAEQTRAVYRGLKREEGRGKKKN